MSYAAIAIAVLLAIVAFKILKGLFKTLIVLALAAAIYIAMTGQKIDVTKLSPFLAKPTEEQQEKRTSYW
jgi:predicted tellurium resistance membrane protein TerC